MQAQRHVVLVERDAAVRVALAFSLGLEGFQVRAFERLDGPGLDAALDDNSCLVLDHHPSDRATIGLVRWLKSEGRARRAVVLATNPCRALRDRVASAGAQLVEKPLIGDALSDALRTLFDMPKAI